MKGFKNRMRKATAAALAALLLVTCCALPALAEAFSAIVTAKTATVYGDAALSERLGTLNQNAVVRVIGYSSDIAKISYQGRTGYARVSDLKRVDSFASKAITTGQAPVFLSPDTGSASVMVPAGTKLYVLGISGDWAAVEKGGAVGYIKTGYLEQTDDNWNAAFTQPTAPEATPGVTPQPTQENGITVRTYFAVTIEDMKVYRSASEKSRVRGTLKPGIQVTVLATSSNGWAYIQLNGKRGFCRTASLREGVAEDYTPAPSAAPTAGGQTGNVGVVSAASLDVYQQASTDSAKLGTLKQGQQVNVIQWNNEWAYIELNGRYGFCKVSGLSRPGAQPTPAPSYAPGLANAKKGTVTASSLPVYQIASVDGAKLGTLKKGQTVNVIETNNGWAYIELNGRYGFCPAAGISINQTQDNIPAGYKKADFTATAWYESYTYDLQNAYELAFVRQGDVWYAAAMSAIAG